MLEKFFHIGAHRYDAQTLAPGLHLCATPIGNLGDVTLRVLSALSAADVILCEDTRVTSRLLERFSISTKMKPLHEHNEESAAPKVIAALKEGAAYVVVSDAGVPLVSDPGYRLVQACVEAGVTVHSLPGASSVLTALTLSGLPTDAFTFIGFLPQKDKARRDMLEKYGTVPTTLIAFESPHRVRDTLLNIADLFPKRNIALCRELTKLHEEVLRGLAAEVHAKLEDREAIKGEIVLVIAPSVEELEIASEAQIELAISAALQDHSASKAASLVAKEFDLSKDDVYSRILRRKSDGA